MRPDEFRIGLPRSKSDKLLGVFFWSLVSPSVPERPNASNPIALLLPATKVLQKQSRVCILRLEDAHIANIIQIGIDCVDVCIYIYQYV